jgi:hypothetical protein
MGGMRDSLGFMGICGLAAALAALGLMSLAGCAASKPAWVHYDECAVETSSFQAMVACGRQKRAAYCQAQANCSASGNAVVMYADSLDKSVSNKEMTEADAQRPAPLDRI